MKRLLLCGVIAFCTTLHAKNLTSINDIYKLKDKQFQECEVNGFSLLKLDKDLTIGLIARLHPFGVLKPGDFDMSACLTKRNLQENVITTYFWQKNQNFVGQNLKSYVAYDSSNKNILVILLDNDLNTYILGNRDQYLIDALKNSRDPSDLAFSRINWSSTRSFRDLGPNNVIPTKDDLLQMQEEKYQIERKDALCKAAFEMADNIMNERQAGVSKAIQLQSNLQTAYRSPAYTKYQVYLINKAYDEPVYAKTAATYYVSKEFAYKSFFECKKSVYSLIP
ncbi:hypothetical protein MWMV2_MWMV2_01060 [Acinetobacter oleivorans]|nr:hypothetical protein MWMV5_MWMV5_00066 [Acinetobacter oleivorans]CAI3100406.1 hypothetical protein MWMV13_MWMV13_00066 [Acinetobacter oleivorans]CAI3118086.1 hypothetical protein MWMV3_MWMV3_01060 [Acinetobacter oleivorans]CAI3118133.1 hypothetical protein MWMV12_MWMV12_01060 [Acinetobacter oleivorans]CAI3118209.1 hypothetical protein MWMV19_MWMV19_01060 [Acinetobacter oleivorans]